RRFAAAVDGGEAVRLRCARRVRETAAWCGPAGARRRGLVHGHQGETAGRAVEWRVESGMLGLRRWASEPPLLVP
ncbi:MAG: hypothetical protein ACREMA_06700, partial [Longimicrobiales bacterium]